MPVRESVGSPAARGVPLILNRKVQMAGSLSYEGEIVLYGHIEGEVRCTTLTIAERGSIDGDIIAERVIVMGEVAGVIYANDLVLKTACNVTGQIYHRNLSLEDGCFFEGQSRRHSTPLLFAPAANSGIPGAPSGADARRAEELDRA